MDTFVRVEIKGDFNKEFKNRVANKAIARMKELGKRFNYFSGDSELAKLNSQKNGEKIPLSPGMRKVLKASREFCELTQGAFDVRLGAGGKIDLGGIAKGFIVDEGIECLKESGVKIAIINAGGDMYCMGENFKVGIKDPKDPRKIIATFAVKNKGVATSGGYERPGHIKNPRTGKPVRNTFRSVTVIANDCMTADALATALYVLSLSDALRLIEEIDGAECVIVDKNGKLFVSRGLTQISLTNSR